jgi:cation transport regulator
VVDATYEYTMPYTSNDELPPAVADHLPQHAQDIFREAFNHAWQEYSGDEKRGFRVAWAAVKRGYHKRGDRWVSKRGRGCGVAHNFRATWVLAVYPDQPPHSDKPYSDNLPASVITWPP